MLLCFDIFVSFPKMPPKKNTTPPKRDASPKRSKPWNNAIVIDAAMGEFKHIQVKTFEEKQAQVGGYLELLPRADPSNEEFDAYVNEEGELKRLPSNFVAGAMFYDLGFATDKLLRPFIIAGNVLLMRPDDRAFSKEQLERIEKAYHVGETSCECSGDDCSEEVSSKDAYCSGEGCKRVVCAKCSKCDQHA